MVLQDGVLNLLLYWQVGSNTGSILEWMTYKRPLVFTTGKHHTR